MFGYHIPRKVWSRFGKQLLQQRIYFHYVFVLKSENGYRIFLSRSFQIGVDEVAGVKPLSDEISGTVFRVFLQKTAMTPTGSPKSSKNFLGKRKNSEVIEFSGKQSLKHGNDRYAACSDEVYNCALLQSGVFVTLSELLNRSADGFGMKRNF